MREVGLWNNEQGSNWLDGGAPFYQIYPTKDKKFYSVACIEPKFYKNFLQVLSLNKLSDQDYQYLQANQLNQDEWPDMKLIIEKFFKKRKAKELEQMFSDRDCCVQKVLTEDEALKSGHIQDLVLRNRKAKKEATTIMKLMQQEVEMRVDALIQAPAAKL